MSRPDTIIEISLRDARTGGIGNVQICLDADTVGNMLDPEGVRNGFIRSVCTHGLQCDHSRIYTRPHEFHREPELGGEG